LLLPIRNDFLQAQRVKAARQQLLDTLGERAVSALTDETKTSYGSDVVGEITGIVLVAVWFFGR
jgi:hypothetical protein